MATSDELPYSPRCITTPASIVHLEYDPASLAPVPSAQWTRFVCISDTHTRTFPVPPGDVLLHSGDLTNRGTILEFQQTMDWLFSLPHKVKIIIAGNHDLTLHTEWYDQEHRRWHRDVGKQDVAAILELLTGPRAQKAGLVYLQDSSHVFTTKPGGRTWSVYGSPWSPYFFNWAFNYRREDGQALVAQFPKTDILLTHGPPMHIFDRTRSGEHVGCAALRARLPHLRPRLHLAGHIHEARGAAVHAWAGDGEALLEVQADEYEDGGSDSGGDSEGEGEKAEEDKDKAGAGAGAGAGSEKLENPENLDNVEAEEGSESEREREREETVFVNAAAWPAGRGAWRGTHRVPFGGPGFQPVVVDLRD